MEQQSSKLTFEQKLALKEVASILLINTVLEDGKNGYAYLAMFLDKLEGLKNAASSGKPFKLTDFGNIVAEGEGEPHEELKAYMTEHYGFNHDSELKLNLG